MGGAAPGGDPGHGRWSWVETLVEDPSEAFGPPEEDFLLAFRRRRCLEAAFGGSKWPCVGPGGLQEAARVHEAQLSKSFGSAPGPWCSHSTPPRLPRARRTGGRSWRPPRATPKASASCRRPAPRPCGPWEVLRVNGVELGERTALYGLAARANHACRWGTEGSRVGRPGLWPACVWRRAVC